MCDGNTVCDAILCEITRKSKLHSDWKQNSGCLLVGMGVDLSERNGLYLDLNDGNTSR